MLSLKYVRSDASAAPFVYGIELSRQYLFSRTSGLDKAFPEPDRHLSTHPALRRTKLSSNSTNFQLSPKILNLPGDCTTVVLRLVNGVTVSLDGHYSIDYYNHSVSNRN